MSPVSVQSRVGERGISSRAKSCSRLILKALGVEDKELSVLLTNDEEMQALNKEYRGKDKPTDVLSFPMDDFMLLGDVVISIDTAKAQAKDFGVTLNEEIARLLVHGVLHLLGYDHEKGATMAKKMKAKEDELLRILAGVKTVKPKTRKSRAGA